MKKILLSLGVFTSISLSAQTIVNGGFENAFTKNPNYVNSYNTDGWGLIINGNQDPDATEGTYSLKLINTDDAKAATDLNLQGTPGTVAPGYALQLIPINGELKNPESLLMTLDYKYTAQGTDKGGIVLLVKNNNNTPLDLADDKILYFAAYNITDESSWVKDQVFTVDKHPTNTGVANLIHIQFLSSYNNGWQTANAPTLGSTLWIDNIRLSGANLNIDENIVSDLKVYPNPATDVLKFETAEEIESVVISSIEGKVVREVKESSNVNVSDLKAGVYVYRVKTRLGKQSTANFIKE